MNRINHIIWYKRAIWIRAKLCFEERYNMTVFIFSRYTSTARNSPLLLPTSINKPYPLAESIWPSCEAMHVELVSLVSSSLAVSIDCHYGLEPHLSTEFIRPLQCHQFIKLTRCKAMLGEPCNTVMTVENSLYSISGF